MVSNSIIEYEVFEFKSFPPTSIYISKFRSPSKDLYATWSHLPSPTWQKEKRGSPVKLSSFTSAGIEAMIFSRRLALLLQRLFIPHLTCIPITWILSYIFTNKQFTWNVSDLFQDYWCMCLGHLILSLIISYPYLRYTQWPYH
jgi:hypothetical protein